MIHVTAPAPVGFVAACAPVLTPLPERAAWAIFRGADLVLAQDERGASLVENPADHGLAIDHLHGLGSLDGAPAFAATVAPDAPLPEGLRAESLRAAVLLLPEAHWAMAAYGGQIEHWDRTTRFCGECGHANEAHPDPARRARRCPRCGHDWFPRVSPCMIALVYDGDRVLLTRQPTWPAGRYGLVAGFVEPGESLEDCVRREVREETGAEVDDVAYAGSQPWPFPHQLMVGFTARYVSGDVAPADGELEDARWFTRDALPHLPPRFSIARRILDAFLKR